MKVHFWGRLALWLQNSVFANEKSGCFQKRQLKWGWGDDEEMKAKRKKEFPKCKV